MATGRRDEAWRPLWLGGMVCPRLELIFLRSASGDGFDALRLLSVMRIGGRNTCARTAFPWRTGLKPFFDRARHVARRLMRVILDFRVATRVGYAVAYCMDV